jgi:hypothetical protein
MREILTRLAAYREQPFVTEWHREQTVFLYERTAVMLRGLVWTCALVDEPWVAPLLGDVAVTCGTGTGGGGANCRSELLANAAVLTLARRGGADAVAALARIRAKVRKKTLLANVAKALDTIADRTGLGPDRLLDRTVPDFGLDADGVREEKIGDYRVRLCVDGPALRFVDPAGRTLKSAPQAIRKTPELAELKATLKELRQTNAAGPARRSASGTTRTPRTRVERSRSCRAGRCAGACAPSATRRPTARALHRTASARRSASTGAGARPETTTTRGRTTPPRHRSPRCRRSCCRR